MRIRSLLLSSALLLAAGSFAQHIDSSFAVNGYLPYQGPNSNSEGNLGSGYASAIQPDGKIVTVLARDANVTSDLFMYLYRYLPNGMPDPTFGVNGSTKTFCGQTSIGYDVEIQPDGKIVMIGESKYCVNGICGASQFVMMRFKTNGSLDSTFGNNGHILTDDVFGTTGTYSIPKSLHILPNGKFLVGGRGPGGKPAIARLNSNGFADMTYGTNGYFSLVNVPNTQFKDMVIGSNGEAYGLLFKSSWDQTTISYDSTNYSDNVVFKLTPGGTLDPAFGTNGIFTFGTDVTDQPFSIALSSTGKLLVAGYNMSEHYYYSPMDFSGYGEANRGFVAFVNANGTLDMNIPNGFSNFDFLEDSATFFNKIIERSPNEFLICGFTTDYVGGNFQNKGLIVSMNTQGQLNQSFNGNGYMIFDHGIVGTSGWNGKLANFMDVDVIGSNKILLTGYRNPVGGATKGSIYILQLTFGTSGNLGVEDLSAEQEFSSYPNPVTNGRFMINIEETAQIELIALDGRTLYQSQVSQGISEVFVQSEYKGVAILKVQTPDGKTGTKKMLFE
ncbi:T9SS type A sorting domain-containing protein [Fluviicola sp.]|uniref:T9SS type A sorting domain-containing protein n=1 Tax=Fluviicola sp. TaxID=1917219 RepID=UPI002618C093|nr:T9SS type A sorting domain-containing protein [Fluviicola sp.]